MIQVEYRRTIWSAQRERRQFNDGETLAQIADAFVDKPPEFASHGGAFVALPGGKGGGYVHRKHWHRVRPKPGTAVFISVVPQGGGGEGGGSGKQIFAIVAAVALLALTAGTASFLAPMIGTLGANIVAGAVAVGGGLALQTLTKPTVGKEQPTAASTSGVGGGGPTIGTAGIAQNPIVAWAQVPCVKGFFVGSPPILAKPYTIIDKTDQVVHVIAGYAGQYDISNIRINDTGIDDFPAGTIEYETREGWMDDAELTLITECVFEENVNQEMSKHRVHADQTTLIDPNTQSYPRAYHMKTANNIDRFRILLAFPSGMGEFATNDDTYVQFRIRIRQIVDGVAQAWRNLPQLEFAASTKTAFRQQIWFYWEHSGVESTIMNPLVANQIDQYFTTAYYSNSEWEADAYFFVGGSGSPATNVTNDHVYLGNDGAYFFFDVAEFPLGQYEVEITRSAVRGDSGYLAGQFTSTGGASPRETITNQKDFINNIVVQSYASFRAQYPIRRKGLCLIAVKARNIQIQSISALFKSYLRVDASPEYVLSNNPAHHFADMATGELNARPIPLARLEDLTDWADHCTAQGLTLNRVIESGTTEDALNNAAQCGDAIMRRSDRYGVVIDRDRSAEDSVGLVSPHVMTGPMVTAIRYLTASRGLVPSFHDETRQYSITEFESPVFDDGVSPSDLSNVEATAYDGITTRALAQRRALRDLRAGRIRNKIYSFQMDAKILDFKKGDKIGLAHDTILRSWGSGRIVSFQTSGGNITSITLNTEVEDVPADPASDNLWVVGDIFLLENFFSITTGYGVGAHVELTDGSIATIPIASISGAVLTVSGTLATPANIAAGCLVNVGPTSRESRDVIIVDIVPEAGLQARIECVDLGAEIYENLAA